MTIDNNESNEHCTVSQALEILNKYEFICSYMSDKKCRYSKQVTIIKGKIVCYRKSACKLSTEHRGREIKPTT
jgi:hypothetical protein